MKAILFDLYGTLVDNPTQDQVRAMHVAVAQVLGIDPLRYADGWKETFRERTRGEYGSVAGAIAAAANWAECTFDEALLASAVEVRHRQTEGWLVPRHDAVETIHHFRGKGIRTGLLSNCTDDVPIIWPSLAFASMIDYPLFSSVEKIRKPTPEFYLRALERLNVEANECLYVADGDNGELAAAKKIGMDAVMIRPSHLLNDYRQDPEEDWAGHRIETLSELLGMLP
ncbi:MAG TPA: HAD family hydrolase [Candidatus Kapabacteria bacterium]|jgi:putative hydrolase of the HAD superfamily